MSICSVARNIYVVTETMASFDVERTTIAADSSDSSDAKKTNNAGIKLNSYNLNGENNNICQVINDIGSMACNESSTKMDENQLNVLSTTTSEIVDVKNGTSTSTSIEDNANAENISTMTHLPLATESSAVSHVEKTDSPVVVSVSGKHVSSDKTKSYPSTKRSSLNTKTGERSQHSLHSSKSSQPTNCGKFVYILLRYKAIFMIR